MDSLFVSAPLPPSSNNAYRTGRDGRRYLTTEAREFKDFVRMAVKVRKGRHGAPEPPFALYVHLRLPDKRRRDVTNAVKLVEDAIFSELGHDDSLVLDAHLFKYLDRTNPGVSVEVRHTDRRLEAAV